MSVRVRQDVWNLSKNNTWDPILEWYAKAILELQSRPTTDPTSWRYQAAIHDFDPPSGVPAAAKRFWRKCQHSTWFFLPWHRMYLACFEQIIRDAMTKVGGTPPTDWALPYWNYSDASNPQARQLPPAFYAATIPDGRANPLLIQQRAAGCNLGQEIADSDEVSLTVCLGDEDFPSDPHGGSGGFGGPNVGVHHEGDEHVGDLEAIPHGSMHVAVGGDGSDGRPPGWMSSFNTAALDPIFWLHHSNIDRLWEVWRRRDAKDVNPPDSAWLKQTFDFHDSSGSIVTFAVGDVVDTTVPRLNYRYEDVSDPLPAVARVAAAAAPTRRTMAQKPLPEMVGATEKPITISRGATASFAMSTPTGPARRAGLAAAAPRKAYLNIENVTGTGSSTYRVYVNLPPDANPRDHEDRFAGLLSTFGVKEASRRDAEHSGSGRRFSMEVTDLIQRLSQQKNWDPKSLKVTFVPKNMGVAAGEVQVGRVSLYYA